MTIVTAVIIESSNIGETAVEQIVIIAEIDDVLCIENIISL